MFDEIDAERMADDTTRHFNDAEIVAIRLLTLSAQQWANYVKLYQIPLEASIKNRAALRERVALIENSILLFSKF
jgi:hypothetical protein